MTPTSVTPESSALNDEFATKPFDIHGVLDDGDALIVEVTEFGIVVTIAGFVSCGYKSARRDGAGIPACALGRFERSDGRYTVLGRRSPANQSLNIERGEPFDENGAKFCGRKIPL